MNNVEFEQVEVTKLLGVTLDCFLNSTINKAGPISPSFVAPVSRVVRCHKERLRKIAIGLAIVEFGV